MTDLKVSLPEGPGASLSDTRLNTVQFLRQLKQSGQPIQLSINGQVELLVQDDASYQKLLELVDHLETLEGIQVGIEDMKAGRTKSLEEVREEFRAKHALPG